VKSVPLGADTRLFAPPEGQDPPAEPGFSFLFSGAQIRRKGFDALLDAFASVRCEEPSARLVVIGPRGDATPRLAGRAAGVSVLPPVPQAELAAHFQRADCLVLPSRNDSFGMVVAEALAAGLPVLVSTLVGAKDLVEEGRTGWVVPAGDAAALAGRMLWCVRHREAVRALRPACRRTGEAATWEAHHRRLVELLRLLLAGNRRAA
jgi:glycosyltransferase involved in cell wall biosynthesis